MLQKFTKNIFENAIYGDFPKCNLHVHFDGQSISIIKDDKKIKADLKNIYLHFNKVLRKTFKNFSYFTADKDPEKNNLMFTKKGTFLDWGFTRDMGAISIYQRYSKDNLQAIISAKIQGEQEFVSTIIPKFSNGLEKYKRSFKDFKKENQSLYTELRGKKRSLKNFRKNNLDKLKNLKLQNYINSEKNLKFHILELMSEISVRNSFDIGFLNETNYYIKANFDKEEIGQIIRTSKFSNFSSFILESGFLNVKLADLDYKREMEMQSIYRESPRQIDRDSELYHSLVNHLKELKERKRQRRQFEISFYGIVEPENESLEQVIFFENGELLEKEEYLS